jgi:predicted ATPase/class 3 adenylate cyclase
VLRALPSGTVTFLFTDVEGSTRLLHELGAQEYAAALAEHRRLLREAFAAHGGVEVDTQGDAFFYAFATAPSALAAAADADVALAGGPIRVRMGLHTGTPLLTDEGYVGADVHRAARIAAVGHGGQVLVSAATRALTGTESDLTDLGEHRLKDLSAPERIYQLGEGEFPPLRSLYRTNLPVPATPFLGRERELDEVLELLAGSRLLTLTGPGGTGKTRLGLQAAGAAADAYPGGVFWVPLATLRDPELVLEEAAHALGAEDGLAEHISDKSLLVLLDNFEQVVDAAGGLSDLLATCPNLRLLVTSREPLHVSGEQEYSVPSFAHDEGVGFFLARARAVDSAFEANGAVPEICRRLDDLPLALELAAARVKALSPAQILERLERRLPLLTGGARDLPERQRTLRATIEWSHDLLDQQERRLFARLAVFAGGCTLEAAERVCDAELDTLQSLVDKSLLRHGGERYWLLETIREYAAERLESSGKEGELHRRHAAYFVALAEEAHHHVEALAGTDPKPWLDRLEAEHDNLRAALDRLDAASEGELEQRVAGALWRFWQVHGHFEEGRRRLMRALAADERPTQARAWTVFGAAVIHGDSGDTLTAKQLFEEALALEAFGDAFGAARVRMNLGALALNEGDFGRSRAMSEQALREFDELGEENWAAVATRNLAWAYDELGDRTRARELHEEVVERARAMGNTHLVAVSLGSLGGYAAAEGRVEEAVPLLTESTRVLLELGDRGFLGANLGRLARVLALSGHAETAAELVSRGEAMHAEIGVDPWLVTFNGETRALIRTRLDEPAYAAACERGRALTPEAAVARALETLESETDRTRAGTE